MTAGASRNVGLQRAKRRRKQSCSQNHDDRIYRRGHHCANAPRSVAL